jgi:hypothetical protein
MLPHGALNGVACLLFLGICEYITCLLPNVVVHTCNPSTWEFKVSLGYIARPCLKQIILPHMAKAGTVLSGISVYGRMRPSP